MNVDLTKAEIDAMLKSLAHSKLSLASAPDASHAVLQPRLDALEVICRKLRSAQHQTTTDAPTAD